MLFYDVWRQRSLQNFRQDPDATLQKSQPSVSSLHDPTNFAAGGKIQQHGLGLSSIMRLCWVKNKFISSFLITPDTLIQTLVLDNKIVGEYSIPYLDNTGICVLSGKRNNI